MNRLGACCESYPCLLGVCCALFSHQIASQWKLFATKTRDGLMPPVPEEHMGAGSAHISGYSGIMQIKFPTYSPLRFFCGLARPCNISGIRGEGLSNDDRVMLLTKCGAGTAEELAVKYLFFLGGGWVKTRGGASSSTQVYDRLGFEAHPQAPPCDGNVLWFLWISVLYH